jgi:16S rRNA (adenine1518-N6/adenine1519-N6)-dimethyltransferase
MGFQNRVIPKRSLGQNFIINDNLVKKIAKIVLESDPEHITEIGPGKGAFTKVFYETTNELTLIEKDNSLAQILKNNFSDVVIHNLDFLDFKLENPHTTYFGSLPFNMHLPIIRKVITSYTFNNPAFFIIQKEVAKKYENRDANVLGLIREIYADFEILFDIKAGNFKPKPNVTSSFVMFVPKNKYLDIDKQALELLIERSFKMPRKTLKNNLKSYHYKIPNQLDNKRPDKLELIDYISILKAS